jgi:PERQ amino acid-rich with GYF domain-containing protein
MQKWYDEGYFTSDLLMKRTHLDTDWTPVGELGIRAGGDKLFLSSFSESGPPGLAPHPSIPSMNGQSFDRTGQPLGQISLQRPHHSEPYPNGSPLTHFRNPVSTRSSALDSLLASSSNPSHSPASSFGAAGLAPVPTASPDPPFGITGSRASFGNNPAEPTFSGRVSGFEQQSPSMASRPRIVGFGAPSDSLYAPRLASLTQRGSMFEAQDLNSLTSSVAPASPWATGGGGSIPRHHDPEGLGDIRRSSIANTGFSNSSVTNIPGFGELGGQDSPQFGSDAYNISKAGFTQPGRGELSAEPLASGFGRIGLGLRDQGLRPLQDSEVAPINAQRGIDEGSLTSGFGNGFGSMPPSTAHGQGAMFGVHGSQPTLSQHLPSQHLQHPLQNLHPTSTFNQFPATPPPSSPGHVIQPPQLQQQSTATPTNQPPWGHPSAQLHPHPFDSPHPSSSNVRQKPVPAGDISSYDTQQSQSGPSDWTSMPDHAEGLAEARSPVSRGAQAGQVQQTAWNPLPKTSQTPVDRNTVQGLTAPAPPSPKVPTHEPAPLPSAKKRMSSSQPSQSAPPKPSVAAPIVPTALVPQPPSPRPATSVQPKPAWSTPIISTDDEAKVTKQAGLREIQEAEAKRVEARKLAEREKERAARAHPAQPQEEAPNFTTSWGLPTSQAGTARPPPKEPVPVAATPSPSSVTPVWTNAAKPQQVKRTMKEIQEEEERRKKSSSKEKETAAAASRRAYADFANKV